MITPEFVWQLLIAMIMGGAIYGGIRSDLKNMHERIRLTQDSVTRAHDRLDRHIEALNNK